ncbi:MotA/TolQ/ExbB proton channel family protein [Ferrimonas lipolytica]|uniref:MotA/TolQ/ExbB proton channel family protein n=1 Tax=Ferrimonas lipolytica TaxID=2724191 RepID=A0A6H1UC66_9GAMM|nr:MotA/TolQ/ExbB proton channel family protein [Ferrimonas lipolytica]QIZ76687.1 MotA/TolQ/ExbB proton channel family protein [Ferrimonas lipolytica]
MARLTFLMLSLVATMSVAQPLNSLAEKSSEARQQEQKHNHNRLATVGAEADDVNAKLKAQQQALADLQRQVDQLSDQFADNEQLLAERSKQLTLSTGALGEVYGVVRQVGGELAGELERGPLALIAPERQQQAAELAKAKRLPDIEQLRQLPMIMLADINQAAQVGQVSLPVADTVGQVSPQTLWHLGPFSLVGASGFAQIDSQRDLALLYPRQPQFMVPTGAAVETLAIDAGMGDLLDMYQLTPTLKQRFEAGGVVGKVIVALLAIGLIISLIRGAVLIKTQLGIQSQLKLADSDSNHGNNPMGRILASYHSNKDHPLDTIELKLTEAIVNEQQGLERGLSMLKLLAALAPMLGLLGTVTGMIETFQVITQYGNGDPKVMAGGISMALITTVLGMVAAMPLLLTHNLLNSRVVAIRSILEKESLALIALHAEQHEQGKQAA